MNNLKNKFKPILVSLSVLSFALLLSACTFVDDLLGKEKECSHEYEATVIAPSCSADGYTKHTCTKCGDSYNDTTVAKVAHTYIPVVTDPTCTEEGYTTHTCMGCGDNYKDTPTSIAGHRFDAEKCVICSFATDGAIVANTEWYSEESAFFTISTPEDLLGLATLVNEGNNLSGITIYLGADIKLDYLPWTPIGTAEAPFAGAFKGEGYSIYNLRINATASNAGLFGYVTGSIENFKIVNATVYAKEVLENIAIVSGYSANGITNVEVSGYVDAVKSNKVGGVAGSISGQISEVDANVTVNGADYVGGIAGNGSFASVIIKNINTSGNIVGNNFVGGMFGQTVATGSLQTDNIKNTANVKGASQVGGIFGNANGTIGSLLYTATVSAKIEGETYVGGLIGKTETVKISECSNEGSTVVATSYITSGSDFFTYLGGYVGSGYIVEKCVNSVNIKYEARGSYVGGIAGVLIGSISDCENNGEISGYNHVGGLVGMMKTTAAATHARNTNNGAVSGKSYVGGVIGLYTPTAAATLNALKNTAAVNAAGQYAGGIVANLNAGSATVTVADAENTGDITAELQQAGGLFGYIHGSTSSLIRRCKSSAAITGKWYVGGLIGYTTTVAISDSSNEGTTVTATGWYTEGSTDYVWLGGYAGCGYKITGCTNDSDIIYDGTGIYVGGIVGYGVSDIQDCTNNGNITTKTSYVGGIAGEINSPTERNISGLTNTGNISGNSSVGGIIGCLLQTTTSRNNANYQNDTGDYHKYRYSTAISNVVNQGNIYGIDSVAGIIGNVYLESSFKSHDWKCCNYSGCDYYGDFRMVANNLFSIGDVSGNTKLGEVFGAFYSDTASTLDKYTINATITVDGELLEGTYDVGSNSNLVLSGREIYVAPDDDSETNTDSDQVQ